MTEFPQVAGGIDAYEFYVEMELHFRCGDCDERLDCPVLESDDGAPFPPWATREGRRGMSLGWYVPPLSSDGSLWWVSFCPSCTQKRGLIVQTQDDHAKA